MKVYVERAALPDELIELAETGGRGSNAWMAYMEYEEDGEYVYRIKDEIPLHVARRLLSRKTAELLDILKENSSLGISEIAERLGRSPPNVHRDLELLEAYNLVVYKRKGRKRIPRLNIERIIIVP